MPPTLAELCDVVSIDCEFWTISPNILQAEFLRIGNSEESNLPGKLYFPFSKALEQDPDSHI